MRKIVVAGIVVAVVAILGYLVYCLRCVESKSRPVLGLDFRGSDILVVCLDATKRGAQFCLQTLRKAKHPERIRFGLIQQRVAGSQNVVHTLTTWHRLDILSRTRITIIDENTPLSSCLVRAERELHQYEETVVLLLPHVSVAQDWDEQVVNLPKGLTVYTAALLRKNMHDELAFPVLDQIVRGVPSFRLQASAEKETHYVESPVTCVMTQCMVLPSSAFQLLAQKMQNIESPDWAFPAVCSSMLLDGYFKILHGGRLLSHLDLNAPRRLPVNVQWSPTALRSTISDAWTEYAGVGKPRGYLGITSPDSEMEWRWKWGDLNAQDVAKEKVGFED